MTAAKPVDKPTESRTPLPRKYSTIPPPRALDFNKDTGRAGICASSAKFIGVVSAKPNVSKARDKIIPATGPAIEKSNNDLRFFGGVASGVIAPNIPV
jgi:hypothetical protein